MKSFVAFLLLLCVVGAVELAADEMEDIATIADITFTAEPKKLYTLSVCPCATGHKWRDLVITQSADDDSTIDFTIFPEFSDPNDECLTKNLALDTFSIKHQNSAEFEIIFGTSETEYYNMPVNWGANPTINASGDAVQLTMPVETDFTYTLYIAEDKLPTGWSFTTECGVKKGFTQVLNQANLEPSKAVTIQVKKKSPSYFIAVGTHKDNDDVHTVTKISTINSASKNVLSIAILIVAIFSVLLL